MNRPILYPNRCVKRIVAAIPPGHHHIRLLIEFEDGTRIILHEATVAAITRAYVDIVTHPTRRATMLALKRLGKDERKLGYAEWQLVEEGSEEEALEALTEALASAETCKAMDSGG